MTQNQLEHMTREQCIELAVATTELAAIIQAIGMPIKPARVITK